MDCSTLYHQAISVPIPLLRFKKRFGDLLKRDGGAPSQQTTQAAIDAWALVPDSIADVSGLIDQIEDGTVDLDDPNCVDDSY
jgi:hypothetical protein